MNNSGLAALTYVGKIQYQWGRSKPESILWFIIEDQAFSSTLVIGMVCRGYHEDFLTVNIVSGGHNQSFIFKALIFWEKIKVSLVFEN